jgi:hypothetical protein
MGSCHDVLSHHEPQSNGTTNPGLEPLKWLTKINISSFQVDYLRYFVTVMEVQSRKPGHLLEMDAKRDKASRVTAGIHCLNAELEHKAPHCNS